MSTIKILFICILPLLSTSQSARILLLPFAWKSHVFEVTEIGKTLANSGHELYIVLPPTYPDFEKVKTITSFNVIDYVVKDPDFYMRYPPGGDVMDDFIESLINLSPIGDMRNNIEGFQEFCSNILSDDLMFTKLKSLNFDIAIVDALPCSRCHFAIPYRLGIPYISFTTHYEPWLFRAPALPSFVPFPFAQYFTERMTLKQRLSNTYQLLDWSYSTRMPYISDDFMRPYIPDKPFRSLNQLAADSKIWLFVTDVVIDYPRPTMPNEINIGGLSTKPAEPLPDDLQKIMDSATKGAIIMSFGSFDALSISYLKRFLAAFEKVEQLVILRSQYSSDVVTPPSNVKIMKWLPQNDLLGHKNTKLFITHCGANGQFEALYHGVPMLGFPIFGDHPYNARRAEYHGFGRHLNIQDFTTEDLLQNINIIMNNGSYYENIRRASAIFRSQPMTPGNRAAYWVEQVLDHGVDHLRSYALDMEWYEYLMLDMIAIFMGGFFLLILVITCLLYHCFCRAKEKKLKIT